MFVCVCEREREREREIKVRIVKVSMTCNVRDLASKPSVMLVTHLAM